MKRTCEDCETTFDFTQKQIMKTTIEQQGKTIKTKSLEIRKNPNGSVTNTFLNKVEICDVTYKSVKCPACGEMQLICPIKKVLKRLEDKVEPGISYFTY